MAKPIRNNKNSIMGSRVNHNHLLGIGQDNDMISYWFHIRL